ncbi:MAG: preprotein translocase subunit YajC [Candidatus Omnitrophica bacterium]|nr:preprotein translocase subunit YajC [Candidatus Omnitrophota bacterium]
MATTQAVHPLINLFPLVAIFVIFYFMIMRPQQKERQEHQKMLAALGKNDEIVTTSGIHGTIVNVKEKTLIVRIDDNVKIELEKSSVAFKKKEQM